MQAIHSWPTTSLIISKALGVPIGWKQEGRAESGNLSPE